MQSRPIEIIGSDNHKYLVETERNRSLGYHMLDVSIIPVKTSVEYEHFRNYAIDISKDIVEHYVLSTKRRYEPDRRLVYEIREILETSIVNSHFDYLHVLSKLKPRFIDLLQ